MRAGTRLAARGRAKVACRMSRVAAWCILLMLLFWKMKTFRWMMVSSSVMMFYNRIILYLSCRLKT